MKIFFAIILAAGTSSRLGFNKLTVSIDGESVIRRSVKPFLTPELRKVFVVTGNDRESVEKELEGLDVHLIHNHDFRKGMSTSIRATIPLLENSDAILFHLGDKPFVTSRSVDLILNKYREGRAKIVLPLFEGKIGHPVMINTSLLRDEIGMLHGDSGLREVIEKCRQNMVSIEGDTGNLCDIDTIQTLDRLRERGYRIEENKR